MNKDEFDTVCCGFCGGNLNRITPKIIFNIFKVNHIDNFLYVLFGGLEELLKMGYVDGFDDLPPNLAAHIMSYDKSIVQRFYRRTLISVVKIGTDLCRYDFEHLIK